MGFFFIIDNLCFCICVGEVWFGGCLWLEYIVC